MSVGSWTEFERDWLWREDIIEFDVSKSTFTSAIGWRSAAADGRHSTAMRAATSEIKLWLEKTSHNDNLP